MGAKECQGFNLLDQIHQHLWVANTEKAHLAGFVELALVGAWEIFGEILCLSCSALPLASVCGCCGVSGGAEPALPYLKSGMWLRG